MPKQIVVADQAAPPGGPYSQARAAFGNLAKVAEAAGGDLSRAVRVGVYLGD